MLAPACPARRRLLAAHKAELDIQDDQEFTPIMRAASYRNQEVGSRAEASEAVGTGLGGCRYGKALDEPTSRD